MIPFEEIKNKVVRDSSGNVIEVQGFKPKDYVVFDRSLGGYSDTYFKIKKFYDQTILGSTRVYIDYYDGFAPVDDFFTKGFRTPNKDEI